MGKDESIWIIGAGAIGGTIAGYLAKDGVSVEIVDPWHQNVDTIRTHGLTVTSPEQEFTVWPGARHLDELRDIEGRIRTAVVAVKSYDTEWVMRALEPYLASEATVVSAQNGVNEDTIAAIVGEERCLGAVVHMAAALWKPAQVTRFSSESWVSLIVGRLGAGGRNERVTATQKALMPIGPVTVSENIRGELWSKLTLNCMANGLSGITGVSTPTLFSDPSAREVMARLGAETVAVSRAVGVEMEPLEPTGSRGSLDPSLLLAAGSGDSGAFDDLSAFMLDTAKARSGPRENRSSLLQDVTKGRRTEIDYLNGHVVRVGAEGGVPTPANASIIPYVKRLEAGELSQDIRYIQDLAASLSSSDA